MNWTRLCAIVLIAALSLCGPASFTAWAQSPPPAQQEPGAGETAAAVFSNFFYIPGKAMVCGTTGLIWVSIMALTFGHLYNDAAHFVRSGCGGKWLVRGEDMRFRPTTD